MFVSSRHGSTVIGSAILLILVFSSAAASSIPRRSRGSHKNVQLEKDSAVHQKVQLTKTGSRAAIETQVLVLGAGSAGVGAGKVLSDLGVDFIILEGKNRIGGRIFDSKLGTHTVEYGANWMHDVDRNLLWDYAQKYGLQGEIQDLDNLKIRSSGGVDETIRSLKVIYKYYASFDKLVSIYFSHCIPTCTLSVRDALTLAGWSNPSTRLEQAVELLLFDWTEILSPEKISFYGFIQPYLLPGDDSERRDFIVTDPRGYSYLLRSIASEYLRANDPRLRFNEVVTSIDYRRTDSAKVLVNTENGNVYAADHVIITFSNSVITYGDVKFLPALPDWKLEALRHMPLSIYTKHFIELTAPVIDKNDFIVLVHEGEDWRFNALWQNLAILHQFNTTNVALVTNLNEQGLYSSRLSPTEAIDFVVNGGSDVYPELAKLDKSRMVETHYNWSADRFARGSYATPIVGLTAKMVENLQASVDNVLHFAGDGTSLDDYGTVTAAFRNGQRVALLVTASLDV